MIIRGKKNTEIARDFLFFLCAAILVFLISQKFDLLETLLTFSHKQESWEIDEFFIVSIFLMICFALYSFRLWLASSRESLLLEAQTRQLKHSLQKNKSLTQQLQQAQSEWERTFDSFTDIVTIQNTELQIVKANQATRTTMNVPCNAILGRHCYDIFHGSNEPCEDCPLLKTRETFESSSREMYHEKLEKTFLVSATPVLDDQGQLEYIAHVAKDITEWKQMEQQLLHSEKMTSIAGLAAGIAHEINTPAQFLGTNMEFLNESFRDVESLIQAYQGLVQAVKNEQVNPEFLTALDQKVEGLDWEYLAEELPLTIKQSRDGIARISKIVLAMKEFSHPGSKGKTPVDLNNIIDTTVTLSSNEWKYVAELETDLAPDLPSVTCFANEMGQVFLNILVNAAHAISAKSGNTPGEKEGVITISSHVDGEWVEVRIRDNGTGMPDAVKAHIFDPFFTTKAVGKGTGQGLAIAYSIVTDKHQGSLSCESEDGVGTSFIIRLPISP